MSDLQSLIERVEKATGPDREIDARLKIFVADEDCLYWGRGDDFGCTTREYLLRWDDENWREAASELAHGEPHYTADIDAALSLVSRALPGWGWSVASDMGEGRVFGAAMSPLGLASAALMTQTARAPTPALAIILALLRAKAAQDAP